MNHVSLSYLADGLGTLAGDGERMIAGLTSDSRKVENDFLFAALPGTQTDGAKFIADAVAAGAAAILGPAGSSTGEGCDLPVVTAAEPRAALARMAARFYRRQPDVVAAVTGTNGKTSVAVFMRQIWKVMGFSAASLGTVGIEGPDGVEQLSHTTPDPVELHKALAALADVGVSHLALEASSHGLAQHRLDGVRFTAAGFTNITRDHLDYHSTFEEYFDAKMRLFDELLQPSAAAVINADIPEAEAIAERCEKRDLRVLTVGRQGRSIRLAGQENDGFGQRLCVEIDGSDQPHDVYLPLVGAFQADNALMAAGLVIASGGSADVTMRALEQLVGARGRLEFVAQTRHGAPVFVDYAHTPDALKNALTALRPYVSGKLVVVFGCGGDRDPGKRPDMGRACASHGDLVILTDDNPRTEEPAKIRADAMAGCPDAIEIAGRAEAIHRGVELLDAGDVLLIAGKGHETGQDIGTEVLPFSDQQVVREATGGRQAHG